MTFIVFYYADNPTPLGKPKELRKQCRIGADSAREAWDRFQGRKLGRAFGMRREG